MNSKSVIDDYVATFDKQIANKKLLDDVRKAKRKCKVTYRDLTRITGYSERHLRYLLSEAENPTLYKDEIQVLSLSIGKGLYTIFGVPDLSSNRVVREEYKRRNESGNVLQIENMNGSPELVQPINQTDFMRSALYLSCLHMCLDKYQDRKAA